ncbi:MAG: hypothetical protein V9E94_18485 [Microthrixaceae bacterium]
MGAAAVRPGDRQIAGLRERRACHRCQPGRDRLGDARTARSARGSRRCCNRGPSATLLDRFAGIDRSEFLAARRAVTAAREAIAELGGDERARARELDLCQFQVDEIDAVAPVPGEVDLLAEEEELLSSAVEHRRAAQTASSLLSDDGSAGDLVARAAAVIGESVTFSAVHSRLVDVQAELADCG